ncbi:MAG: hypothetical protein ACRD4O_00950 [Bryobacteraceae bacterium]
MSQLRVYMIGISALLSILCGCSSERNAQLKPETFVGEYIFQMGDSGAPHHAPDRLALKADGKYVLVHMPGGRPGSTEKGTWHLFTDFEPRVGFGNRTYPVEIKGERIRLLISDDLGYWYQKVK